MSRIQQEIINIDQEIIRKQQEMNKLRKNIDDLNNMKNLYLNKSSFYNISIQGQVGNIYLNNGLFISLVVNSNKNDKCFEIINTNIRDIITYIKSYSLSGYGRLTPKQARDISMFVFNNTNITLYDLISDAIEEYRFITRGNSNSIPVTNFIY